jgi:cellulose synthase/poly-beta-1,6-N-acetylglucosamine synthase-like glycosyltransferase
LLESPLRQASAFTIGICASDRAENLTFLVKLIESETFPEDIVLKRVVIVASGCSEATLDPVRHLAKSDDRILLIEEKLRHGKASAINAIQKNASGNYLVFINSDAIPGKGSIAKLLSTISQDGSRIGVASGCPSFNRGNSATSLVEELMWSVHNECSLRLNHMNLSNHGSDEMMVVRTELLSQLPDGLVNDGAYIAGNARLRGYSVKFCNEAPVRIDVPSRCVDLIRQRQRIIFGHFQVWRLTGRSPKTVESLLLDSPKFSLALVVRTIAANRKLLKILPLVLVSEAVSIVLGLKDSISSTRRHGVWKRYGN